MSLLMEALKQQQGATATPIPPVRSELWRALALLALVLVGVGLGFSITYWLAPAGQLPSQSVPQMTATEFSPAKQQPLDGPVVDEKTDPSAQAVSDKSAAVPVLPPAHPGLILSDLLAQPMGLADEQLVISAARGSGSSRARMSATAQSEQFTELPPMAEADVTAPVTAQAEPELQAEQVPAALREKFRFAVEATSDLQPRPKVKEHAAPARDIRTLDDILQRQIPPLRFEAHVYATDPSQRWVKVNGKDLQEGQWVTADIQLKEITPNYVMLQTGRQLFSMEALTDWSYRLPAQR